MSTATASPVPHAHHRLLRNVLYLGLGQVATTVLAIVLNGLCARTLGASDYGVLYVLGTIATLVYVFVDWGHAPYIIREIARHPERAGALMGTVFAIRAMAAIVGAMVAVGITIALNYDARTRLLTAPTIIAWLPMYTALAYAWVFRARERMDLDAIIGTTFKLTLLVFSFAALLAGGRIVALMAANAIAGLLTLVVAMTLYRRLHLPPLRVSPATSRELIVQGVPLATFALAGSVQPYIDANILYAMVPPEVVGWFGATWSIAGTLVAPAGILGASLYPRFAKASDNQQTLSNVMRLTFRPVALVAMLGAGGTFLFADVAIDLIYGHENFGGAATVLRCFAPVLVLLYVDMLLGDAILASGRASNLAKAKAATVVVTTIAELLLVPFCQRHWSNGAIGIVAGLLCGEIVMFATALVLVRPLLARSMAVDGLRALAAGILAVGVTRLSGLQTPFATIPLYVALFCIIAVALRLLTRADLDLLLGLLRRRPSDV